MQRLEAECLLRLALCRKEENATDNIPNLNVINLMEKVDGHLSILSLVIKGLWCGPSNLHLTMKMMVKPT